MVSVPTAKLGINYGANLGDDVTYSGTVSAAMEAVINMCPAFAISQEYYEHPDFDLARRMAHLTARNILEHGLGPGELLNINVPAGEPHGVQVTRLGKRIYRDELKLDAEDEDGGRRYWIYGADPGFHDEPGTDLAAVHAGHIAVTPVHFDLTDVSGLDALTKYDLARLLAPAAREVQ